MPLGSGRGLVGQCTTGQWPTLGNPLDDHRLAARALPPATRRQPPEVRLPAAVVVVDVDRRDARALRSRAQPGEPARHRHRVPDEALAARELEVVDNVEQQERHGGVIRHHAVEVGVPRGSGLSGPRRGVPAHCFLEAGVSLAARGQRDFWAVIRFDSPPSSKQPKCQWASILSQPASRVGEGTL